MSLRWSALLHLLDSNRATLAGVHVTNFLGIELIVDDLDRAIALFVELLGFELHVRGESDQISGDVAVVTDGTVAITLLHPTTDGTGPILPDRTPRLSQLILGVAPDQLDAVAETVVESGLAVSPTQRGFYVGPESASGALGVETAIVVTADE